MDIAVIGSNMVDLITYTNQMPKEGETLEAPAFKNRLRRKRGEPGRGGR